MEQTKEIVLRMKFTTRRLFWVLALAFFVWRPGLLDSSQSLVMTSYYPAPYGGYNQLMSYGDTYLGERSASRVTLSRNGGRVCVGGVTGGADGCPSGNKNTLFAYSDAYFGKGLSNSTFNTYGVSYLSKSSGQVYIGDEISTNTSGMGLFSKVPIQTNKWMYLGNESNLDWLVNNNQNASGTTRLLISQEPSSWADVAIRVRRNNLAGLFTIADSSFWASISNVSDQTARLMIGGATGTSVDLVADGETVVKLGKDKEGEASEIRGNLYLNGNLIFSRPFSSVGQSQQYLLQHSKQIKNMCYYKRFGHRSMGMANPVYNVYKSGCAQGFMPVGFLPASSEIVPVPIVYGKQNQTKVRLFDVNAMSSGVIVCCALDIHLVDNL